MCFQSWSETSFQETLAWIPERLCSWSVRTWRQAPIVFWNLLIEDNRTWAIISGRTECSWSSSVLHLDCSAGKSLHYSQRYQDLSTQRLPSFHWKKSYSRSKWNTRNELIICLPYLLLWRHTERLVHPCWAILDGPRVLIWDRLPISPARYFRTVWPGLSWEFLLYDSPISWGRPLVLCLIL